MIVKTTHCKFFTNKPTLRTIEVQLVLKVSPADGLSLSQNKMGTAGQIFAAHNAGKAIEVKHKICHPHHQVGATDLLHAPRALDAENSFVVGFAVKLQVTKETGMRQTSVAGSAGKAILVVAPLRHPHHVPVHDALATSCANRL